MKLMCEQHRTMLTVHRHGACFPVRRVYCVGRNYAAHAQEMGATGREPPFFFMKPADAICQAEPGEVLKVPYPALTQNLQHEVELVVAIGRGGSDIPVHHAWHAVYAYAVGIDLTRRDLQAVARQQGHPWDTAKGFDGSGPVGRLLGVDDCADLSSAVLSLSVNGQLRQQAHIGQMIWSIPEVIAQCSRAWTLAAGDLIYTGTPSGVGALVVGDIVEAQVAGLPTLQLEITPALQPSGLVTG